MTKWEYATNECWTRKRDLATFLNEWGEEGWELVSITVADEPDSWQKGLYTCVFKRPIEDDEKMDIDLALLLARCS